MVSPPDEMVKVSEKECKERSLETVPETIRVILRNISERHSKRIQSRF